MQAEVHATSLNFDSVPHKPGILSLLLVVAGVPPLSPQLESEQGNGSIARQDLAKERWRLCHPRLSLEVAGPILSTDTCRKGWQMNDRERTKKQLIR